MNITKRFLFAAAITALITAQRVSAAGEHFVVEDFPFDDVIDYPCIGEQIHVTGSFLIETAEWTDGAGAIHSQFFERAINVDAVGLVTGNAYRYKSTFRNLFHA